jgi:very-short-patch-repair endonuclease
VLTRHNFPAILPIHGGVWRTTVLSDRRRDQRLMLLGYRVVRFTRRQVVDDPDMVEATVRELRYASIKPRRIA